MNFKLKSMVQWAISVLPYPHVWNRFLQIHVARSLPISDKELNARREIADRHLKGYFNLHGKWPDRILDIGAGSDLALPILLAERGADVVACDIHRLATPKLIDDILKRTGHQSLDHCGVRYVVYSPPKLPFADGHFDLITSTSVLEHVPVEQLPVLLRELRRVLKSDGLTSHHIAHKDHWSDSDPALHSMNYVRYEPDQWVRYNPPIMFQNRVMHSEYCNMMDEAGFDYEVSTTRCETSPPEIAKHFQQYSDDDLVITHSWFSCRPTH